jgi:hypothetical protein
MYRIVTEDKNVEEIKVALVGFDVDFTLFRGIGSWRGKEEQSVASNLIASHEQQRRWSRARSKP